MKNFIILVVVAIALVGIYFLFTKSRPAQTTNQVQVNVTQAPLPQSTSPSAAVQDNGKVHEITITAKQFVFNPSEIRVKEGEKVRLKITSVDVTHGFALPEFNVNATLDPQKEQTVEFVANKKGEFTFFCSVVCGRGHRDMTGKLIVE